MMRGDPKLYQILNGLNIPFDYYEHPPVPTVEEAVLHWKEIKATHCKNLFFRNHKGNKHYLVVIEFTADLAIRTLEQRLRQGKLTFASPERLNRFLGLEPGSVTPLALINDPERLVTVFLDESLQQSQKISFHPCVNSATIVLSYHEFLRFLAHTGHHFEYINLQM